MLLATIDSWLPREHAPTIRAQARLIEQTLSGFLRGQASVCLQDDRKLHHLSAAGLELIPVAGEGGLGSGLVWQSKGAWKTDSLQIQPPKESEGMSYCTSGPMQFGEFAGLIDPPRAIGVS